MSTFRPTPDDLGDSIPSRLRDVMGHFKLNQAQLAELLGVERATVSKMFKTGTNPRAENLQSLVRALPEISLDWLILGEGEMLRPSTPNPRNLASEQ